MKKALLFLCVMAICSCIALLGCGKSSAKSSEQSKGESNQKVTETIVADSDELTVVFKGIDETAGIEGATLLLSWENKTDSDVTVYPENGDVNGYSVLLVSGVPTDIHAGGKSNNPLIITFKQLDVDSASDIKTVAFDAVMRDGDFKEIATVPVVIDLT